MAASRIDTHHHAVPDFYRAWLKKLGTDAGGMPIPKWTPEASRRHMKLTGVRTAILSISTPQVTPGNRSEAHAMARRLNEYLHGLTVAEPGTFGYFATLPLPDATSCPVGATATALTQSWCPVRVRRTWPDVASQMRTA